MNNLIIASLKILLSSGIFYLIYSLFLQNQTFFKINRTFILFALIFSLTIPFLSFPISDISENRTLGTVLNTVSVGTEKINTNSSFFTENLVFIVLKYIYLFGVAVLSFKFMLQTVQIARIYRTGEKKTFGKLKLIYSHKDISTFSFFKLIFTNEKEIENKDFSKILLHEKTHAEQLHSLDAVILEIICILQWYNPFVWKFRNALKETHEYLADKGVLEHGFDSTRYSMLLLEQTIGVQPGLANNLNKSLTFKRLTMMKRKNASLASKFRILAAVPAIALVIFAFACKNEKTEEIKDAKSSTEKNIATDKTSDVAPEFPGGQEALMKFIADNVKYPEQAIKEGISGMVYVEFNISKEGKVNNVKIAKGAQSLLDAEAIRVVSLLPDWIPGEMANGEKSAWDYTIPIKFKLD